MDPIARLVVRMLMGERYEAPSEADTRYWVSVLAVLPIVVGSQDFFIPLIADATLVMVWVGLMIFGVVVTGLIGVVYSIPSRAARVAITLIGWGILLSYYGRQFVLLMSY